MGLTNEELKAMKKDDYEALVRHTSKFLDSVSCPSSKGNYLATSKVYSKIQCGEIMEKLQLNFALKCLQVC